MNARLKKKWRGPCKNKLCTIRYRGRKQRCILRRQRWEIVSAPEDGPDVCTANRMNSRCILSRKLSSKFHPRSLCGQAEMFVQKKFSEIQLSRSGRTFDSRTNLSIGPSVGVTCSAYTNACVSQIVLCSAGRVCLNISPPLPLRQVSLHQDQRRGCLTCSGRTE